MHFEDKNRPEGATWMPLILGRNALHFQSSCLPSWHHRQQKPTQQFFLELPLHVRFMEWSCSIWVLWDYNNSLQPAHDLQEIQNFMLHLGTGTRLTSEWEGQREWEPHDRKEHQGPGTGGDMERQTVQGPGGTPHNLRPCSHCHGFTWAFAYIQIQVPLGEREREERKALKILVLAQMIELWTRLWKWDINTRICLFPKKSLSGTEFNRMNENWLSPLGRPETPEQSWAQLLKRKLPLCSQ